ncbi:serine hydrolase, partial [Mycobacterium tuberculosis]|nr:serine hydrolase [Mycobacterium tuberculosis]
MITRRGFGSLAAACLFSTRVRAGESDGDRLGRIVGAAIRPVMQEHRIPGMAVAVTIRGRRAVFNYGLAEKESGKA